jgi:Bacterial mobilisation protein (MobC)
MGNKTQRADGVPRKITLHVRFAVDENEQLKNKAYQARVSVNEFIRRASLRKQVVEPPPPPELNWKLYEQLGAIGNNINQIARGVNSALKAGLPVNIDEKLFSESIEQLLAVIKETQLQLLESGVADEEAEDEEF